MNTVTIKQATRVKSKPRMQEVKPALILIRPYKHSISNRLGRLLGKAHDQENLDV